MEALLDSPWIQLQAGSGATQEFGDLDIGADVKLHLKMYGNQCIARKLNDYEAKKN